MEALKKHIEVEMRLWDNNQNVSAAWSQALTLLQQAEEEQRALVDFKCAALRHELTTLRGKVRWWAERLENEPYAMVIADEMLEAAGGEG